MRMFFVERYQCKPFLKKMTSGRHLNPLSIELRVGPASTSSVHYLDICWVHSLIFLVGYVN